MIVFTKEHFSHLTTDDFRNYDHYKPWNISANTGYVYTSEINNSLTKKLFNGPPMKYAYGPYDSEQTKSYKKSYNAMVNRLYDSTNKFSSMAQDSREPTRIALANIARDIRRSNYIDYKKELDRRVAHGLPTGV